MKIPVRAKVVEKKERTTKKTARNSPEVSCKTCRRVEYCVFLEGGTKKVTRKSETVKSTVSKDTKQTTVDTKKVDVTSKSITETVKKTVDDVKTVFDTIAKNTGILTTTSVKVKRGR